MSRQHWIDEFFRKRMERRTFPVEAGEFEEVRALLAKRNAGGGVVGGGGLRYGRWWLSALIPVAGLLWWAVGGEAGEVEMRGSTTTAHQPNTGQNGSEQHAHLATSASDRVEADPSIAPMGTESTLGEAPATSVAELTASVNAALADANAKANLRRRQATEALRVRPTDAMDAPDQISMNAQADDRNETPASLRIGVQPDQASVNAQAYDRDESLGSLRSGVQADQGSMNAQADDRDVIPQNLRSGVQADQGSMNAQADDGDGTPRSLRSGVQMEPGSMNAQADDANGAISSEGLDVLSERSEADAVAFMVPRWTVPRVADARTPVQREMPVFKLLATGELHVFGAPLAVRTKSSGGDRSSVETGSLFGFEYRVRAKRVAWATGIYYGSYAVKADQGATDVTLDFVEVPLLASYGLSYGRFGLVMQGGMSIDLLFNSNGRYPLEDDRVGAGFPDDAFRTANYSWLLRPQATYHFSEHLSVCAGPLLKAQLGEVAQAGPLDGARVSSSGVSIGITWRLERSTF